MKNNKIGWTNSILHLNIIHLGSGCVAQLVERPLPIPEVRGSNPVIYMEHLFTVNCVLKRRKEKKKNEAGNGPFKKIIHLVQRRPQQTDKNWNQN